MIVYHFQLFLIPVYHFLNLELVLKQEMISCMKSVKKQLAKLTKKVDFLAIPSSAVCIFFIFL